MIPTSLRLPADAKAFIEAEARENASSQNSEIVRAIRSRMKEKGANEPASSSRLGNKEIDYDRQTTHTAKRRPAISR